MFRLRRWGFSRLGARLTFACGGKSRSPQANGEMQRSPVRRGGGTPPYGGLTYPLRAPVRGGGDAAPYVTITEPAKKGPF